MAQVAEFRRMTQVHSLAGSFAGAAQTAFWHPLDVLKTRILCKTADGSRETVNSLDHFGNFSAFFVEILEFKTKHLTLMFHRPHLGGWQPLLIHMCSCAAVQCSLDGITFLRHASA